MVQPTDDITDSFSLLSWLISIAEEEEKEEEGEEEEEEEGEEVEGEEEEEEEELPVGIGRKGKATPRTNGAMLSVTLRPKNEHDRIV